MAWSATQPEITRQTKAARTLTASGFMFCIWNLSDMISDWLFRLPRCVSAAWIWGTSTRSSRWLEVLPIVHCLFHLVFSAVWVRRGFWGGGGGRGVRRGIVRCKRRRNYSDFSEHGRFGERTDGVCNCFKFCVTKMPFGGHVASLLWVPPTLPTSCPLACPQFKRAALQCSEFKIDIFLPYKGSSQQLQRMLEPVEQVNTTTVLFAIPTY